MNPEHGLWWQDFHARQFDNQLGRWHVPDPAGQFVSPYIGMGNNPIMYTDPNGCFIDYLKGCQLRGFQLYLHCQRLRYSNYVYNDGMWHQGGGVSLLQEMRMMALWREEMNKEQRKFHLWVARIEMRNQLRDMGIEVTANIHGELSINYYWSWDGTDEKNGGRTLISGWGDFCREFDYWIQNDASIEHLAELKQAIDGYFEAPAQSNGNKAFGPPAIGGLAWNGAVYGSKKALTAINNEIIDQANFNNSMKKPGVKYDKANILKVPKPVKFVAKYGGVIFSAWDVYSTDNQWRNDEISTFTMIVEQVSNGIGAIPIPIISIPWTIGWEAGRTRGPSTWYGDDDNKWFE